MKGIFFVALLLAGGVYVYDRYHPQAISSTPTPVLSPSSTETRSVIAPLQSVQAPAKPPAVLVQTLSKCTDASGNVIYSDQPCGMGQVEDKVTVSNYALDNSTLRSSRFHRPGNVQVLDTTAQQKNVPVYVAANKADSIECGNAMRSYKFDDGYRFASQQERQAKRTEVYRVCGYWP